MLHNENQLRFPVEATKGLYVTPSAEDITRAFENVKPAIRLGPAVDETSQRLVCQAVGYDIKSLRYMFTVLETGPFLERLGYRVFRIYQDTFDLVTSLR